MPATITEHKKCICVCMDKTNNNKFWEYTLYSDGTAMTAYGRVGVTRKENFPSPSKALDKWRTKTRASNKPEKRYTEVKAVGSGGNASSSGTAVKSAALKPLQGNRSKAKTLLHKNLLTIVQRLMFTKL